LIKAASLYQERRNWARSLPYYASWESKELSSWAERPTCLGVQKSCNKRKSPVLH